MERKIALILRALIVAGALAGFSPSAGAQTHYRFAHDQQLNSGYSVAYDIFSAKLKQLSGGQMLVDQYPGAQLGKSRNCCNS
jgi:TRAP-type transport system periplasmic protein